MTVLTALSRCCGWCAVLETAWRAGRGCVLQRRGNGAGVEDVFAHVGAVVDAGDDHVGPGVDVAGECEVDAVGWCAVHAPDACAVFGDGEAVVSG